MKSTATTHRRRRSVRRVERGRRGLHDHRAKSLEEAIESVKRAPNIFPGGKAEIEIRKLMDVEDFGEEFTPNEEIAKVKY